VYAGVYKFVEALAIGGESTLPAKELTVIDLSTSAGKEAAAAKKRNAITMPNLTMAFKSKATMRLAYKAMSSDCAFSGISVAS
jgi:hypothetical protein